ncbi:MAG TPA: GGDEF domain-containing protein, partial [Thermodesulfovibrionales bacterium]|nr:GGDEF domain-containing protein [Thermodesulfovibrionales bacterium]
ASVLLHDTSTFQLYARAAFSLAFAGMGVFLSRYIKGLKEEGEKNAAGSRSGSVMQQNQSGETVEQTARFLDTIFRSIRDPFIILDRDYTIVRANPAYSVLKQVALGDLVGRKCYEATRKLSAVCEECIVAKTFRSGDPSAKEKKVTTKHGTDEWVEIYTYPVIGEEGEVTHVIEYVRYITDRKRADEQRQIFIQELEMLSSVDALTGLLNRRMLYDRLHHEIERVRRYKVDLALMFCDLDNFKEINDTHGHGVGDEVLKRIAGILKTSIRTSDIVGRYGGDEFLVVLPQTSLKGAHDLAERIRASVQEMRYVVVEGQSLGTTMSIGVTYYAGGEPGIDALINRIDTALYVSKKAGKNQVYSLA